MGGESKTAEPAATETKGFLGFYTAEIKRLVDPAGPLLVMAIYTVVMLFPHYHRAFFRRGLLAPRFETLERALVGGVWYALLPLAAIGLLFVLSRVLPAAKRRFPQHRLRDFGCRLGRAVGWRDALIFYIIMLPVIVLAAFQGDFAEAYPLFALSRQTLLYFMMWEGARLLFMVGWEFIHRGFLLFGLEKQMGRWAVLATAIPFALVHMSNPELEAYGSFIAALVLGWLALRARSFLPGMVVHWALSMTLDICIIIRAGGFG